MVGSICMAAEYSTGTAQHPCFYAKVIDGVAKAAAV